MKLSNLCFLVGLLHASVASEIQYATQWHQQNAFHREKRKFYNLFHAIKLFQKQALVFLCLHYKSFKKSLWEKEKLLVKSNFSFSRSVFFSFGELSVISIEFEIVICKTLPVWKSLKFVVWERVKNIGCLLFTSLWNYNGKSVIARD